MSLRFFLSISFVSALACSSSEATKFHTTLDSSLGFATNPYSIPLERVQHFGSGVFRARPSLEFEGEGHIAKIFLSAKADGAIVFGQSQASGFMLSHGEFIGKSELNSNGVFALDMDGLISTSREVEHLYVASLTQVKSDFRFGVQVRPSAGSICLKASAQVQTQNYFDITQPAEGAYSGVPDELSNQGYFGDLKLVWEFEDHKEIFARGKYGLWRGQEESKNVDVNPLWIDVGIASDIAPGVKGSLSAGYANSYIRLLKTGTVLEGASAAFSVFGETTWAISPDAEVAFTLERELSPTPVFLENYRNAISIHYNQTWMKNLFTRFAPAFVFYEYGKPLAPDNMGRLAGNHRSDIVLGMKEEVTYFFTNWFGLGLSHQGQFRWTNAQDLHVFKLNGKLANLNGKFHSDTNRHEILVFGRLTY